MDNEINLEIEDYNSVYFPQIVKEENERSENEEARKTSEKGRNLAEETRVSNETTREANEQTRLNNEVTRTTQYNQLVTDTQTQINNKYNQYTNAIAGLYEEIAYNSFDNVAAMKACTRLENGAVAQTLGYYSVNDGGAATYKIRTKTSTDVEDNGSIHFIGTNLVAELIVENESINVKQFGAYCDNTNDDSSFIQKCINSINTLKGVKQVFFNNENDILLNSKIQIKNINNVDFIFKGKIHRASSTTKNSNCFELYNCKNCNFVGSYIYSERNKNEDAPEGHTRESNLGSNIVGFRCFAIKNCNFENVKFENMASDFFNQISDEEEQSENINIDGWFSENTSLPLYMANICNLHINNAHHETAKLMGGGDHCLYLGSNVNTVYVTNSQFKAGDVNFGALINFRNANSPSDENAPKNLYVDNCYFNGKTVLSLWYNSNASIINSRFSMIGTNTSNVLVINSGNPSVIIDNCKITNVNYKLYESNANVNGENIIVKNSIIKCGDSVSTTMFQLAGKNSKIKLLNNVINYDSSLCYIPSSSENIEFIAKDNIINQNSNDSYLFSNRNTSNNIKILSNTIKNTVQKTNLMYNASVDNSNTHIYFNSIKGYTQIANSNDISTIHNNSNYIENNQ